MDRRIRRSPPITREIGIDPATGTILRLTLRADMIDDVPMNNADLMVEYGTVEIGGVSYVCPVRSVAAVEAYQLVSQVGQAMTNPGKLTSRSQALVGIQTILNDVEFGHYQVLRSDAKVITGADMEDGP